MSDFSLFNLYTRAQANREVIRSSGGGSSAAPPVGASDKGSQLSDVAGVLQIAGAMQSAIGAWASAESAKSQAKAQALSMEFESSMSAINARVAESEANAQMEAGAQEIARVTAEYGQAKAAAKTSAAAAGIKSTGSAAEVQASIELAKRVDAYTINVNRVRSAEAARTQAVNSRNQSLLSSVSARNARATANSINPWVAAGGTLLSSAGQVAGYWANRRR